MLKKERKKKSVISTALYVRFAAKHGLALDTSVEGWSGSVWLCVLLGAFGRHVVEHRTQLACPWCENVYHTFKLKVLTYYGLDSRLLGVKWKKTLKGLELSLFTTHSGCWHIYVCLEWSDREPFEWRMVWNCESPGESAWFSLQTSPIWFPMDQWAGIDCCVAVESCGVQAGRLIPQNVNSSPEKRTRI